MTHKADELVDLTKVRLLLDLDTLYERRPTVKSRNFAVSVWSQQTKNEHSVLRAIFLSRRQMKIGLYVLSVHDQRIGNTICLFETNTFSPQANRLACMWLACLLKSIIKGAEAYCAHYFTVMIAFISLLVDEWLYYAS